MEPTELTFEPVYKVSVTLLGDFEAFVRAPDSETAIEMVCAATLPARLKPTHKTIVAKLIQRADATSARSGDAYLFFDSAGEVRVAEVPADGEVVPWDREDRHDQC